MANNVFVFGASGHAKVVIDILEQMNGINIAFVVDDTERTHGQTICGHSVIGGRDALLGRRGEVQHGGIVAIGDNGVRARIAEWLADNGILAASALHPGAVIARSAEIGNGTAVMGGTVINAESRVGSHVIINTGATIDHDCTIGDCVHIAPGCNLCGGVSVGRGTTLGVGTKVIPGIRIGSNAVIGAGSTVLHDVPDGARMAGSPCRSVES